MARLPSLALVPLAPKKITMGPAMRSLKTGLTLFTIISPLTAFAQGFLEDSKVSVQARNFYYSQDIRSIHTPGQSQWGQGFIVNGQSGYTAGSIGVGMDALALSGLVIVKVIVVFLSLQ